MKSNGAQALATLSTTHASPASGMPVNSHAFRPDALRGLVKGFGTTLLVAVPFVLALVS